MRIATWNVNSIRTRVDRVVDWLVREDVDTLAMQEIKCRPDQFPDEKFHAAGYEVVLNGHNQWNGVAIASRKPLTNVQTEFPGMPGFLKGAEGPDLPKEARAIAATTGGVRIWSLYAPNGRTLEDPHYFYKLDWLNALAGYTRSETIARPELPLALMGDFNIAPLDEDNGDPSVIPGRSTHVSPQERAAFFALENAGVRDIVRPFAPEGFTYWDYQQLRFPRNEGMRIDFILGSAPLEEAVTDASIHRNERKGASPSDHVPVLAELALSRDDQDIPMIFS